VPVVKGGKGARKRVPDDAAEHPLSLR